MILIRSKDHGASLYHSYGLPEYRQLMDDGRIRPKYDRNDWTPGDYVYSEHDQTLRLTGTGEPLWTYFNPAFFNHTIDLTELPK